MKSGKAVGPDGLAIEAYKICPTAAALKVFPLFLKSFLGAREPVEWRGGCLIALAKKATTVLDCSGFRSILLASTTGKLYHRVLRGKLSPHLEPFKSGQQAGTSKGVGVDTVSLMVRSFQGWAMRRSHTTAITFYDIKAAYYRVLRQTLLQSPGDDRALLRLLHKAGIPSEALPELHAHLANMALLAEANVSVHMQSVIADLFRGSWFRLEPETLLTATHRGSRPGDPLADLLFGFCLAGYLRSVEETLVARRLSTPVPEVPAAAPWHSWPPPATITHAAWADDYAHLQQADSPADLEPLVVQAVQVHLERASSVGMALTFAPDKTAVLLPLACSRAPMPCTADNPKGLPGFTVTDAITGTAHFLPIVDCYRHLGGIITANCAPAVDIAYRFSMATAVLRPLRRKLFANKGIPLTVRAVLLRSLVVSRFVFACAVVDLSSAVHRRTWCRHYVELWSSLLRPGRPQDRPHSFLVLLHADVPSPLLALAQARAVFLHRLLRFGPAAVLHLLHAHWRAKPSSAWLSLLVRDLQAVGVYLTSARLLLQTQCPVTALVEAMQDDPGWWLRQVRAAAKAYKQDLRAWAQGQVCGAPPPARASLGGSFRCRWCAATFTLHKAVALHEAKSHAALCPVRHFSPVPWCLACMTFCHTVERVQYHLRRSRACLLRCAHVVAPMSLAAIREAEGAETALRRKVKHGGWQNYRAAAPALPCQGPRLPTYDEAIDGLDEDELTLCRVRALFRPDPDTLSWVEESLSRHSKEGARTGTVDFWLTRPIHVSPSNSVAVLDAPE